MPYRVALLALCFALPAFAQTVASPQPEEVTTIDAERLEGVGDIEITARGNAEIRRGELTIFGQILRFNAEYGRAQGEGGVRLQRGPDRFFGPRLEYNTREDTGRFESPHYLLQRERFA
jgi:LPS-assembly protein